MSELGDIRDEIQDYIQANVPGMRAHDTWPATIHPPATLVKPLRGDYGEVFGAGDYYYFELVVVVRAATTRSGQDELDEYMSGRGEKSIAQAFSVCPFASVRRFSSYGQLEVGGATYWGAVIDLEVRT